MSVIETVRLGDLVIDPRFTPRGINKYALSAYVEQMREGAEFPPILVDRDTMKIIDGRHRHEAALRVRGVDGLIAVGWESFPDEIEMWKAAVAANAGHGTRYTGIDISRIVLHSEEEFGLPIEEVALLLRISVDKLEKRTLYGYSRVPENGFKYQKIPVKHSLAHLHGEVLTEQQQWVNLRASGQPLGHNVRQVIMFLENDAANLSNPELIKDLIKLREVLDEVLRSV